MAVVGTLSALKLHEGGFCVGATLDYGNDATGLVRPDVVPNDGKRTFRVILHRENSCRERVSAWIFLFFHHVPAPFRCGHAFYSEVSALQRANVLSLPTLRSFCDFEFHALAFLQAAKSTGLDRRE